MIEFYHKECIVIGQLNPAIVVPHWLVANEILEEGEGSIELTPNGPATYRFSNYKWIPDYDCLRVFTEDNGSDPGEFVGKIFEKLMHTPIIGVENVFAALLPIPMRERVARLIKTSLEGLFVRHQQPEIVDKSGEVTLVHDNARVTLSILLPGNPQKQCEVGVVFRRRWKRSRNFQNCCTQARDAARKWSSDKEHAIQLVRPLLEGA